MENVKTNQAVTANGAVVFNESESKVLDLFNRGGSLNHVAKETPEIVTNLVKDAFEENPLLTVKTLFYLRDFRGKGQGSREVFRIGLRYLTSIDTNTANVVPLVAEYGRFDDLLAFIGTSSEKQALDILRNQMLLDLTAMENGEPISLVGKWLPSINTSSFETVAKARKVASHFGMSEKEYRKTLSKLRKYGNVLEVKLTEKDYSSVDYDKIPSKALNKYRSAFYRNDGEKYTQYLDAITSGEKEVKVGSLYPHDVLNSFVEASWGLKFHSDLTPEKIALGNAQWDKIVSELKENVDISGSTLPVIDVSGSMTVDQNGLPIKVALALGILMAEANKGRFHNKYVFFDSNSKLNTLKGDDFYSKLKDVLSHKLHCLSTNIESTFDLILDYAVENNLPQEELPNKLVYFSDMQFNQITSGDDTHDTEKHLLSKIQEKFNLKGYKMPKIVFWNLAGKYDLSIATKSSENIALLSGFSDSQMARILSGDIITPYTFMMQAINDERYDAVEQYYTLNF